MSATEPLGWARLWAAAPPFEADPMPRQGAWYPVVSTGASRVVVDVRGTRVALPADVLEIRDRRPQRFTVVYRTLSSTNPAEGTRGDLGRVYAVCPECSARVKLIGHPRETKCSACAFRGEIAWWETG